VEVVRVTITAIDVRATFVVIGLLEDLVEFSKCMVIHAAFSLDAAVVMLEGFSFVHVV
jgi:hypothetical protein